MQNMNDFFWNLRKKIQEFEKLDSVVFDNLRSGDFEFLDIVLEAKKEVKRLLSDKNIINTGPDQALAGKLKKIRDDYGYNIDIVWHKLEEILGENFSQSTEENKDYVDALFSEGTADYVDDKFFQRRNEIGAIIGGRSLPEIFLYHLSRLKECYSLGLFESTVIYCRAVIESGVFQSLNRRGKIKTDKKITDYGEYSLKDLLNRIKPYTNSFVHQKADEVVKLANKVLHEKRNTVVVSKSEAYDSIKNTFAFIEDLFA